MEEREGPTRDTAFELLAERRRRIVLELLREEDAPVALADLARKVADREPDDGSPERVYRSLYHCHVPKLAAAGVVERRLEQNTVTLGPHAECVLSVWRSVNGTVEPVLDG